MTKTLRATLAALIGLAALAALILLSDLLPGWVGDVAAFFLVLPTILYGLGRYLAWCRSYWRLWRRRVRDDAAGGP